MRRSLLAIALLAIALTAGACAASEAPGWTYAPPTEAPAVTPAPSGGASPAAPSGGPAVPTPVPGGETAPTGDAVAVSAVNISYDQKEISAPADAAFVIRFDNKDAGIPHNVEIKDASGMSMFKGEIINGPSTKDYQVPALASGTYQFVCTVHPNMAGTLKVGS
jgi:plastocyanin